jgi:hypothetical protein
MTAPHEHEGETHEADDLFPELAGEAGESRRRSASHLHALPSDVVLRLNGALAELMECRRLLAVARGIGVGEPDGA